MSDILDRFNLDMEAAIGDVRRSLVQVSTGRRGHGAGTVWHADGLVLTNAHVVRSGSPQVTLWDGRTFPAQVLARDHDLDLAALAVQTTGLPTIQPGSSKNLLPGEWVMAVGHPWGVLGAVTSGVVIGVGPQPFEGRSHVARDWVAVSAHMRPGHSGGPLVDARGRLVGINTMIAGPDVGYAVPVHVVKAFLKDRLGSKVEAVVV